LKAASFIPALYRPSRQSGRCQFSLSLAVYKPNPSGRKAVRTNGGLDGTKDNPSPISVTRIQYVSAVKHLVLAVFFAVTTSSGVAHADGQEIRRCDFEVKARCASGGAPVTLVGGVVKRIEVNAFWCGLKGRNDDGHHELRPR
jgi:hypothetical protein